MGTASNRILPARSRLTYEDYLELPEDGRRYEILDGELAVTPPPTTRHQGVSVNLIRLLGDYVADNGLGVIFHAPVGVILADDCIVEPDLVYVAKARAGIVKLRAIEGPPDLVVEILSKSTGKRDRSTKANLYARYGVANYWIFDPDERTVDIYERGKRRYKRVGQFRGNTTFSAQPFATLQIDLSKIWR